MVATASSLVAIVILKMALFDKCTRNSGNPKKGISRILKVGRLRTHPFITIVRWATRLEIFVDALTMDALGPAKRATISAVSAS